MCDNIMRDRDERSAGYDSMRRDSSNFTSGSCAPTCESWNGSRSETNNKNDSNCLYQVNGDHQEERGSITDTRNSDLDVKSIELNSLNNPDSVGYERVNDGKDGVKPRQSSKEVGQRISLPILENYYNMPLIQAAKELKVSNTMLKKLCRKYRIQRWPHRQIRSIDKEIKKQEEALKKATAPTEKALTEQKVEQLKKKRVMVTKMASCGLNSSLRSAIFQARPGEIDTDEISGLIPAFQAKSLKSECFQSLPGLTKYNPAFNYYDKNQRILPKANDITTEEMKIHPHHFSQMYSSYPMTSNWVSNGGYQGNFINYVPEPSQYHHVRNFPGYHQPVSHVIPPNDQKAFIMQNRNNLMRSMPFDPNSVMNQMGNIPGRNIAQYAESGNISRLPSMLEYQRQLDEI